MSYDPRRAVADFIDRLYSNNNWGGVHKPKQHLTNYQYCGRIVGEMSTEEASNIVQTKLTYAA